MTKRPTESEVPAAESSLACPACAALTTEMQRFCAACGAELQSQAELDEAVRAFEDGALELALERVQAVLSTALEARDERLLSVIVHVCWQMEGFLEGRNRDAYEDLLLAAARARNSTRRSPLPARLERAYSACESRDFARSAELLHEEIREAAARHRTGRVGADEETLDAIVCVAVELRAEADGVEKGWLFDDVLEAAAARLDQQPGDMRTTDGSHRAADELSRFHAAPPATSATDRSSRSGYLTASGVALLLVGVVVFFASFGFPPGITTTYEFVPGEGVKETMSPAFGTIAACIALLAVGGILIEAGRRVTSSRDDLDVMARILELRTSCSPEEALSRAREAIERVGRVDLARAQIAQGWADGLLVEIKPTSPVGYLAGDTTFAVEVRRDGDSTVVTVGAVDFSVYREKVLFVWFGPKSVPGVRVYARCLEEIEEAL